MKRLNSSFNVMTVSSDATNTTKRKWLGTKNNAKRKAGYKDVKLRSLTNPQVAEPLLEHTASKEVPAILMKTVLAIKTV